MAQSTRIFTINQGEEAIIRVNSNKHVTLEFSKSIVTLVEEHGVVYMRQEFQEGDIGEPVMEVDVEQEETQIMETQIETQTQIEFTPPPPVKRASICLDSNVNITFRKPFTRAQRMEIEGLQQDLFGYDFNE